MFTPLQEVVEIIPTRHSFDWLARSPLLLPHAAIEIKSVCPQIRHVNRPRVNAADQDNEISQPDEMELSFAR